MEYAEHVEAVEPEPRAGRRLPAADPGARVPSCPDWTVADLAEHVGGFSGFWAHVLCEGTGRPKTPFPEVQPGASLGDWYGRWLPCSWPSCVPPRPTQPSGPGPTTSRHVSWAGGARTSWRCTGSTPVAIDAPLPIDAAVAADGIDEIFYMVDAASIAGRGEGQTLHLHGTERGDEWLLTLDPDGLQVERRHAKGNLRARARGLDLELLLYQRPTLGNVERLGDERVLAAWQRVFTFG